LSGHLRWVALALRVAGWALGVPSLLSTLGLTVGAFVLRQAPATPASHSLDIRTYGLVGLLENGARGVAKTLEFLISVGTLVVTALAIASLAATLIALILYLAGRGVQHHATWARIVAILIFLGLLAATLGALSVLPRILVPVDCLLIGLSLYSLWVLVWRFD
jgi:hypothetical protein